MFRDATEQILRHPKSIKTIIQPLYSSTVRHAVSTPLRPLRSNFIGHRPLRVPTPTISHPQSNTTPNNQQPELHCLPSMLAESQALITFAERIRECQLDRYGIHVPQIAVVGAQSSGKSSVLESITGIPFPRDAALCTRGPMEVRLKMCTDPDEEGIDVFRTEQDRRKFRLGEEQSPAFAEHLQTVVQSVMTGLESKFTDEVIIVEVRRVNQIPFTVIDLPGYYQCTCLLSTDRACS